MWKCRIIVFVLLALLLLGAGPCTTLPTPAQTPEKPVTLPVLPNRPSDLTEAERAAAARLVVVGQRIAHQVEATGVPAGSEAAKQSILLWSALQTWLGVVIEEPVTDTVEGVIAELKKAGDAARKLRAEFAVKYQEAKAALAKLERENILSARNAAAVHKELLALRESDAAKAKRLKELASSKKSVTFWGINIFGIAGVVGIAFCFLRFGRAVGIVALAVIASLYVGGLSAYVWEWHHTLITTALIIAGVVLVVGAVAYAFWGTVVEKIFTPKLVARTQAARKKLGEADAGKLAELDESMARERALVTDMYVKSVKAKAGVAPVTP